MTGATSEEVSGAPVTPLSSLRTTKMSETHLKGVKVLQLFSNLIALIYICEGLLGNLMLERRCNDKL
jgi:hypothetical protein